MDFPVDLDQKVTTDSMEFPELRVKMVYLVHLATLLVRLEQSEKLADQDPTGCLEKMVLLVHPAYLARTDYPEILANQVNY
jgi:hypothetical protein